MTAGRYEGASGKGRAVPKRRPSILFLCHVQYKTGTLDHPKMKSLIVKRSVVLGGHKTSVSVEDPFWNSVKEIAASGKMTVSELLTAIDSGRHHGNLSSAIRLFVLNFYQEQLLHRPYHDKRGAIQRLISGSARVSSKASPSG